MWLFCIIRFVFLLFLVLFSINDIKKKEIPVVGLIVSGVVAIVAAVVRMVYGKTFVGSEVSVGLLSIILGIIPGAVIVVLALATKKVGLGDGILLCFMGLFESYISVVIVLCIGSLIMAFFSIVLLISKKATRNTKLPFVPFIATAFLINLIISYI